MFDSGSTYIIFYLPYSFSSHTDFIHADYSHTDIKSANLFTLSYYYSPDFPLFLPLLIYIYISSPVSALPFTLTPDSDVVFALYLLSTLLFSLTPRNISP